MLTIFLLNPHGYYHFRLTMQRYEKFMTPPNLEGSEFTLLSTKICKITVLQYYSITVTYFDRKGWVLYIIIYIILYYIYNKNLGLTFFAVIVSVIL